MQGRDNGKLIFVDVFNSLLSVEIVVGPSAGMGIGAPGPTMADRPEKQHQPLDYKGTVLVCCQSGSRRVRQGCNVCALPATRLRIRSDGHFFAHGMPDRPRVVSSACGPRRDGATRG